MKRNGEKWGEEGGKDKGEVERREGMKETTKYEKRVSGVSKNSRPQSKEEIEKKNDETIRIQDEEVKEREEAGDGGGVGGRRESGCVGG